MDINLLFIYQCLLRFLCVILHLSDVPSSLKLLRCNLATMNVIREKVFWDVYYVHFIEHFGIIFQLMGHEKIFVMKAVESVTNPDYV